MSRRALIEQNRDAIIAIVRRHKGRDVYLFGSVARGDDGPTSDIDVLVEFDPDSSLFDLLQLQDDLKELLGCDVDVISVSALQERDEHIRQEAIPL